MWIFFIYEVFGSSKQAGPLWQRLAYREAKKELSNLFKSTGEEQVTKIQASDWKREQNRLDSSLQEYLDWLSMDWAENFENLHNSECTSSSSWSPSPKWWSSSEVGRNGTHTGGMTTNGQINGEERQHRRYSTWTVEPWWHLRSFTLFLACLWGHNFQFSNSASFFFFLQKFAWFLCQNMKCQEPLCCSISFKSSP